MADSNKKDGTGSETPSTFTTTASASWFKGLKPRDTSGDVEDEDVDLQSTPEPTKVSPLESWINGYDKKVATASRKIPHIASAFARPTHTPAAMIVSDFEYCPYVAPASTSTMNATKTMSAASRIPLMYNPTASAPKVSDISRTSPPPSSAPSSFRQSSSLSYTSYHQLTPQPAPSPDLSSFATAASSGPAPPQAPISSPIGSDSTFTTENTALAPVTPPPSYTPPRISNLTDIPPLHNSISTPGLRILFQTRLAPIDRAPISSWEPSSITRDWTRDQVQIAIERIMSEINLDWYAYNYLKFDFDGSLYAVWIVWREISNAYAEYLKSHMIGLDILTTIAINGGPLENVKHTLADMFCFFAAGKIGMESRAEEMAMACITEGDIVSFVRLRCAENGLTYPGGTGLTEERVALARSLRYLWQ